MAENQIIAATIQVDTGNSGANVSNLNKETSQLKSTLGDVGAVTKGAGKEVNATGEHFGKLKGQIAALPGPAGQLTGSIGGVNQAFNILRANPIIGIFALIAGLIVALFDKFRKMEGVSDSLGKAWGVLSTIFSVFMNKILTPLIDGFTTLVGWVTKAATFIADIFSPGIAEAAKRGGELAEALDDLNDAEAKSAISRAESNRKLQEARDLANDANVPIQERIKALKEAGRIEKEEGEKSIQIAIQRAKIMLEQIAIELGARDQLIQAIRNGSVEQLKAARDEIMSMQNVDKEKLKAIDALIIQAEDTGASLAKVNKKTESGITALEKEEQQKRKDARDKAIADHKQAEQKLAEFRNKLRQLQQDNELAQIKDGYQKELRQLELKLENDKKANEAAVKSGNLTRAQANQLDIELQKQHDLKLADITDKHNKEVLEKEEAFQKELRNLKLQIRLAEAAQLSEVEIRKIEETQKRKFDVEKAGMLKNLEDQKRVIQQTIDTQKKLNDDAFNAGKLSKEQYRKLNSDLDKKLNEDQLSLQDSFNDISRNKEQEFQKELDELVLKAKADRLAEARQIERDQLENSHKEDLAQAEKNYKDDADKLAVIKLAIDEKYRADKKNQDEKFAEEDRKTALEKAQKDLDKGLKGQDKIINDPEAEFDAKKTALDIEQKLIEDAFAKKILTEEAYTDKVNQLAEKRKQIADLETEHKKQQTQEIAGVLNNLAGIVGKQTVAGKALGIANALINTYQGATDALRAKSTLPSPFDVAAKVVNVAAVIATGLKSVKAITQVQVPGGGGATPSLSPEAPVSPTVNTTKIDADSINQINNQAAGGVNRVTTRAYVVNSDIQSETERNARLERAATLGGGG